MTHKNNVVVVIPVYKNNLDVYESISLEQAHRVLGQYEIRFIAPRGWRATYGGFSDNIKVEYFEARFFQSKHTYSSLMLQIFIIDLLILSICLSINWMLLFFRISLHTFVIWDMTI